MHHHDPLMPWQPEGIPGKYSHDQSSKSNDSRGRVDRKKFPPYSPYENGTDHADRRGEGALNDSEDRVGNEGSTHDLWISTNFPRLKVGKHPLKKTRARVSTRPQTQPLPRL